MEWQKKFRTEVTVSTTQQVTTKQRHYHISKLHFKGLDIGCNRKPTCPTKLENKTMFIVYQPQMLQ